MFDPLYTAIAWVMKQWHTLFSNVLDPAGGITWALAIIFLVVTVRLILFPLFVKQVKSQRAMQELQPEIQKLRQQYGSDRENLAKAMMELQKERGVNPLAGCLPILPQIPVFLALFHVLRRLAPGKQGLYSWSTELTQQASVAELFGAPISSSFDMSGPKEQALLEITGGYTNIRIVAFVLIVVMCLTTFFTQKQIMARSGPVEGQAAMIQKFLLYVMPLSLFVTGFFFPIGVLLYWFTNNLWTLGQQFFILRKLPPPGSDAAKAKAAANKPAIDPRTLAPKPGVKPVRAKGGRAATPPVLNGTESPGGVAGLPDGTIADGGTNGATAHGATAHGATADGATGDDPAGHGPAGRGAGGHGGAPGKEPRGRSGSGPSGRPAGRGSAASAKRKRR